MKKSTSKFLLFSFGLALSLSSCGIIVKDSTDSSNSNSSSSNESHLNGEYKYEVYNVPTWVREYNCTVFIWSWSAKDDGSWTNIEFTSNTSGRFYVKDELIGFLLARFEPGVREPSWSSISLLAQTRDIVCDWNLYLYECPDWTIYREYMR